MQLADRLGYVISVVEPETICEKWNDLDYLMAANDIPERKVRGKMIQKVTLSALLNAYEPLQNVDDASTEIRSCKRPEGTRVFEVSVEKADVPRPAGNSWKQVKVEQGQKRPAVAVAVGGVASKARYLPTPAARAGYYGR